jgi:hypothetical protein
MSVQFSNFKSTIKDFLKLDEEIRALSKAKLERTRARDKLSKEIMSYYKTNDIHSLDLNMEGSKQQLELVESTRHPSVNQKFLREALVKYCNNDKIVDNMIDHILGQREQTSSVSFKLKRVISKTKKSSSSESNSISDPMKLTAKYENDKIKDRFAKLAEYAILKDSIAPPPPPQPSCQPVILPQEPKNIKEIVVEPRTIEVVEKVKEVKEKDMKKIRSDSIDDDDDEEDVDLDEIPEEDTGYVEPPPKLEEEFDNKKTFRTVICQKLDSDLNQIGSIPKLSTQTKVIPPPDTAKQYEENSSESPHENERIDRNEKNEKNEKNDKQKAIYEFELKTVEAWKKLDSLSQNIPNLNKWLNIQREKMKILKVKEQTDPKLFVSMMTKLKNIEKECEKYEYPNEINILRSYIIKYINLRFG